MSKFTDLASVEELPALVPGVGKLLQRLGQLEPLVGLPLPPGLSGGRVSVGPLQQRVLGSVSVSAFELCLKARALAVVGWSSKQWQPEQFIQLW